MNLITEDYIKLVTGKGMWHTNDCNGKLNSLHLSDGPHGLRKQEENVMQNNDSKVSTCFPTASAVACSWDENVVSMMGNAIAKEAFNEDVSVLLGPGINIKRSPLCGRNFEYFSEDPFLAGKLGCAYVNAVQKEGIAVSLKHFAGNSQETHRQTANSQIDERALREIYLSAFEMVVKNAKPATIMASYNRLNGDYACENKHLLTEILRDEWGFDGVVVSDWGACVDLANSIKAGMDLEMPDSVGIHTKKLKDALANNEITEDEITASGKRIIALIDKYAVENRENKTKKDISNNHNIAKEIECKSAVLLKNDGVLPIKKNGKFAVIGELANTMRFQGGGSSHINTIKTKSAIESLKEKGIDFKFSKGYITEKDSIDNDLANDAVKTAKNAETVLFFGGLTDIFEGEGYDRKTLSMPNNQLDLFEKIYSVNQNIIFVSFGGSPYDMSFADKTKAILHMYLGGQAVGEAVAELLTGEVNPSGKLAETFPLSINDIPSIENFATGSDDVEYRESIFVGYRYYDKYNVPVRFPFGYGLSYTTFEYSNLNVSETNYKSGDVTVSFDVKNTGNVAGAEISQIYVENPSCNFIRATKELKGFAKTELEPNESKTVTVTLNERSFSVFDVKENKFIIPSGEYKILVGASSCDIKLSADINVNSVSYDLDSRGELSEYFDMDKKLKAISHNQFVKLYGKETSRFDSITVGDYTVYNSLKQLSKDSKFGRLVMKITKYAAYSMFKGKPHDDPEVMMMIEGIQDGTIDSVVCQSDGMVPYKLAEAIVLSANGHSKDAFVKLIKG